MSSTGKVLRTRGTETSVAETVVCS